MVSNISTIEQCETYIFSITNQLVKRDFYTEGEIEFLRKDLKEYCIKWLRTYESEKCLSEEKN
jgi:hypothetical protein